MTTTVSVKTTAMAELKAKIRRFSDELDYLENAPADLQVDEAVTDYLASNPGLNLSYAEAMQRVLARNPNLAKEYGALTNERFAEANPSVNFQVRE